MSTSLCAVEAKGKKDRNRKRKGGPKDNSVEEENDRNSTEDGPQGPNKNAEGAKIENHRGASERTIKRKKNPKT